MNSDDMITSVQKALHPHDALRGVFLSGSLARDTADRLSDIDLIGICDQADQPDIAKRWRATLATMGDLVMWRQGRGPRMLINAITEDWTRWDMLLMPADGLKQFSRCDIRPLIDRDELYMSLQPETTAGNVNTQTLAYVVEEFFRVLGLLPVVVHRKEYVTAVKGVSHQRDHLIALMKQEPQSRSRGGALHLSRDLTEEQMAVLKSLPYPRPKHWAVIDAHMALAKAFLPRARTLCAAFGVPWPDAFEAATRRHLQKELGLVLPGGQ